METMTRDPRGMSRTGGERQREDMAEAIIQRVDRTATKATKISIFHLLAVASIGASIALFLKGRKLEAIFVGLWPPTFEALKSASERKS
jgi:hypothetical protein